MNSAPPRRRARRLAIIVASALAATLLPVLAAPAGPASAMTIDCAFSPGLKDFIDSGGAPGVRCGNGVPGPGSGGSTTGGGSTTSGGGADNCQPHTNSLPAWFFEDVTRQTSTTYSSYTIGENEATVTAVQYYLKKKLHGSLSIYSQRTGSTWSWIMVYSLFDKGKMSQAIYSSGMPCGTGYTYVEPITAPAPSGTGVSRANLVGPGLPTTPLLGELQTRGSMTPLPGKPDEYLVRVDVTNPAGGTVTPAEIELGFGESFDLTNVISTPSDATCHTDATDIPRCSTEDIAAGQTRSFVFATKAKAGVGATVDLPITVWNIGFQRIPLEFTPGVTRTVGRTIPVINLYKLDRPAPVVIAPAPATPVCAAETAVGSTALPGTEGDQIVIAGQSTKLVKHCTNSSGLPMRASALHGTTTMDGYGWVTYTPDTAYRGPDVVSVVSYDAAAGKESEPASFAVSVVAPAQARDDAYTVTSGTSLATAGSLLDNDQVPATDGWMVQAGATPPGHGTLSLDTKTGRFSYTPTPGFVGTDSFRYRLSGPGGAASNVVTVTFTVTAG